MLKKDYDTLSQAINALTEAGYKESFTAGNSHIIGTTSKKQYPPEQMKIVRTFRFEGQTNPQDSTAVFALEADDGSRGTLVMSYSAKHNQNVDLIRKIPQS
jgi:hypothetical protein